MFARFDLIGGWTDASPYCLENPGAVINLQLPQFEVRCERQEGDENAILEAVYRVLGKRVPIRITNTIPRSAGLGGSSILAAEAIRTIEPEILDQELIRLVLEVEREIGTNGGWQDIVGGMLPGLKLTRSFPEQDDLKIQDMDDTDFLSHCLLIDTQIRREVPSSIMRKYAQGDRLTVEVLKEIHCNAIIGWRLLKEKDYKRFAELMHHSWILVQRVEEIEPLVLKGSLGYKLGGAGGGGFILAIYENRPENPDLPTNWKTYKF